MKISDNKTIREIQLAFQQLFPYLKLEFYTRKHGENEGSPKGELLDPELKIGQIRKVRGDGELQIDGEMTVGQLESAFADNYGLFVQVFRKSTHDIWLQTISTDDWKLRDQNQKAEDFIKKSIDTSA